MITGVRGLSVGENAEAVYRNIGYTRRALELFCSDHSWKQADVRYAVFGPLGDPAHLLALEVSLAPFPKSLSL